MRVFVTGGTGFLGAHVVRELLASGHEVSMLARDPARVGPVGAAPGVSLLAGTLNDVGALAASLRGHEALVHNALIWEDELALEDTRAAVALFQAAARAGVEQTVFTSSTAVHRPFHGIMDEDSPLRPADYYGATKAAGELFLSAVAHQFPMRCNVLRLGPIVGPPAYPGGRFKCDDRFTAMVVAARHGDDIAVVEGDGRQFVGARDAARVYRALLESNLNRQTLVCVAEDFTTWECIARDIVAATGSRSRVNVSAQAALEAGRFDVAKLHRALGFRLESAEALREHVDYLVRRHPG